MAKNIFVGRTQELEKLQKLFEEVKNDLGKIIFIEGDPGSGKSTLVKNFISKIKDDALVAVSECTLADNIHNAYAPFNEAITKLKNKLKEEKTGNENKSEVKKHSKKIFNILTKSGKNIASTSLIGAGVVGIIEGIENEYLGKKEKEKDPEDKQRYFETVLRKFCEVKPVVLFIDDLQWADKTSIDLFYRLGRSLKNDPFGIMIIGTYRPYEVKKRSITSQDGSSQEVEHPFSALRNKLKRINTKDDTERTDEWFIEMAVPSFDNNNINELINKQFPDNQFPGDFAEQLNKQTKGRALFICQILDSLYENGDISQDDNGKYILKVDAMDKLPSTIEAVIKERLSRLGDKLKEVVNFASVTGEDFYLQIIQKLLEIEGVKGQRELFNHLNDLEDDKGIIVSDEKGQLNFDEIYLDIYHFTHTLHHKYIYVCLQKQNNV